MTDPRPFIDRLDAVLAECDADQLPPLPTAIDEVPTLPVLAARIRVPREMVETTPTRAEAPLAAEYAANIDDATRWPEPANNPHVITTDEAWRQLGYQPAQRRRWFRWPWTRT